MLKSNFKAENYLEFKGDIKGDKERIKFKV